MSFLNKKSLFLISVINFAFANHSLALQGQDIDKGSSVMSCHEFAKTKARELAQEMKDVLQNITVNDANDMNGNYFIFNVTHDFSDDSVYQINVETYRYPLNNGKCYTKSMSWISSPLD